MTHPAHALADGLCRPRVAHGRRRAGAASFARGFRLPAPARCSPADSSQQVTFPCCIDVSDAAQVLSHSFLKLATLDDTRPASWYLSDFVHVACAAYVSGHDVVQLRRLMEEFSPEAFHQGPRLTSGERRVRNTWLDVVFETLRQRGTPSRCDRPPPGKGQLDLSVSTLVGAVLNSMTHHPELRPFSKLRPSAAYAGIGSAGGVATVAEREETVNVHMVPLTQVALLTVAAAVDLCAPCEIEYD